MNTFRCFWLVVCLILCISGSETAAMPIATVGGPFTFVRDTGKPLVQTASFTVGAAGAASLIVENGPAQGMRVSSCIIKLNGSLILGTELFNQNVEILTVPVQLVAGANVLSVELRSKPGSTISAAVVAPADSIKLLDVSEVVTVGTPLACTAAVTALGTPVSGASVVFFVTGIDGISPANATTDSTGIATAMLAGFQTPGFGVLHASVQGVTPAIEDACAFQVEQPLGLTIEAGAKSLVINQGAAENLTTLIDLDNPSGSPLNVTNTVTVSPDTGGISVVSDYPSGGYNSSTSTTFVLNQSFGAISPGNYLVTNTARITGTDPAVEASCTVELAVVPAGGDPGILPVGSSPDALTVGTTTPVVFTAMVSNQVVSPTQLYLHIVDGGSDPVVATMLDDGTGEDLQAADGVYACVTDVIATAAGKIAYYASANFPGAGERFSTPFLLTATLLPTTIAPSDPTKIIDDPATGLKMAGNEILVKFVDGTADEQVVQIAAHVNGTTIGALWSVGIFQIQIPYTGNDASVYQAINVLSEDPLVIFATPNYAFASLAFTPNDTSYGLQWGPGKIRADEAWTIARGGVPIAIVDTGVDYTHPDLSSKVIKGKNWTWGIPLGDPKDDFGHGTHCAGIAAAITNNGTGIAGISWGSTILAEKANMSVLFTLGTCAAAITDSANRGAKVISCSWGLTLFQSLVMGALSPVQFVALTCSLTYAQVKGCLVCVAAGNESTYLPGWPAIFPGVFVVGSTDQSDSKSSFSNYGPWVHIGAPGSGIYSTMPTYNVAMNNAPYNYSMNYDSMSGTSMATPCVSGAAAVVWQKYPSWSAGQVKTRLMRTATALPGAQLGSGRLDLFDAVFNGSFEDGTNGWTLNGTCSAVTKLGPIKPTKGEQMGMISSGPSDAQVQSSMEQPMQIQSSVTSLTISFDYNFVTEEYPEWVHRGYNDNMRIKLQEPDGSTIPLAYEDVDSSSYTLVGGIDFPGGDNTVGQTGWKSVTKTFPVTQGTGNYRIVVRDEGDGIYDSVVLIDNIRLK